jgi:hypothetical protein
MIKSTVCIPIGYRLEGRGVGVRVPVGSKLFLKMGTVVYSPEVKRLGFEADHSSWLSTKIKKSWIFTPTPANVFMAECLVKHRNNFSFLIPDTYFITIKFKNLNNLFLSPKLRPSAYEVPSSVSTFRTIRRFDECGDSGIKSPTFRRNFAPCKIISRPIN